MQVTVPQGTMSGVRMSTSGSQAEYIAFKGIPYAGKFVHRSWTLNY